MGQFSGRQQLFARKASQLAIVTSAGRAAWWVNACSHAWCKRMGHGARSGLEPNNWAHTHEYAKTDRCNERL
jgi:hypothetical protein